MMRSALRLAAFFLLTTALAEASAAEPARWPSFRGEDAAGVAYGALPPDTWNVETGDNVLWQTPLPGLGHSGPVIWGDRIFVTTAVNVVQRDEELKVGLYGAIGSADDLEEHRYQVMALDRSTGDLLWLRTVFQGVPATYRHTKASHANSTPATDGEHVVAFFGSEGLYCLTVDGELKWKKDLGVLDAGFFMIPTAQWGFGSSPVIHGDKVLVQVDVQKDSYLAAFSLADGSELWRTPRDEVPTWGSPTVVEAQDRKQVVVNGWKHIGGYDLETGAELWKMKGGGDIPVPTPIFAHDLIFITNAHGGPSPVWAVRPGAEGDISLEQGETANEGVAWSVQKDGAYMQTPIVVGEELFVCRDNGVLSSYDAKTGELHFKERLSGSSGFTASAVAAVSGEGEAQQSRLYFTGENGDIYVLDPGTEFVVVAQNETGAVTMATPALVDGVLYFRTRDSLLAIGEAP